MRRPSNLVRKRSSLNDCIICKKKVVAVDVLEDMCAACGKESSKIEKQRQQQEQKVFAKRLCNLCDCPLPPGRYFHCRKCIGEEDEYSQKYDLTFTEEEHKAISRIKNSGILF